MLGKRVAVCTVLGGIFGIVCMLILKYYSEVAIWPVGIYSLIHHSVMGFAIGTSSLKLHWAPHGILWGILFGLFLALSYWEQPQGFWASFLLVILWAFLIDAIASAGFGLKVGAVAKKAGKK